MPLPSLGNLGIEPKSPGLAGGFFTAEPPGKPKEGVKRYTYFSFFFFFQVPVEIAKLTGISTGLGLEDRIEPEIQTWEP